MLSNQEYKDWVIYVPAPFSFLLFAMKHGGLRGGDPARWWSWVWPWRCISDMDFRWENYRQALQFMQAVITDGESSPIDVPGNDFSFIPVSRRLIRCDCRGDTDSDSKRQKEKKKITRTVMIFCPFDSGQRVNPPSKVFIKYQRNYDNVFCFFFVVIGQENGKCDELKRSKGHTTVIVLLYGIIVRQGDNSTPTLYLVVDSFQFKYNGNTQETDRYTRTPTT